MKLPGLNVIKKTGMKKKLFWGVVIAGAIAGAAMMSAGSPTEVTLAMVQKGTVQKLVEDTAVVSSRFERQIYAGAGGEILTVSVQPGDTVKTGAFLAEIDVRDVDLSIRQLRAQKSALEATYRNALKVSPQLLEQAGARVENDHIAREAAQRANDQNTVLAQAGAVSTEELNQAQEALRTAEQDTRISQAAYDELAKGLTPELKQNYLAQIEALQAQIDQLEVNRSRYRITATQAGVITLKEAEPGMRVQPGALLFEVADTEGVRLETDVLAADLGKIQEGTPFRAYDEEAGIDVKGVVERVYPKAFSKQSDLGIEQKRIHMELKIDSHPAGMRLGMELNLELIEAEAASVLTVSDSAVFKINEKPYVFRVVDGVARLTAVETGLEGKETVEIRKGLSEGDSVIDAPGNDLKEGMKVKAKVKSS